MKASKAQLITQEDSSADRVSSTARLLSGGPVQMARDPWADLVVALLSVNNYPLEKTFGLLDPLRENRLCDPAFLGSCDAAEIARRLNAAGYRRGATMLAIFTDRLASLGLLATTQSIESSTRILTTGSRDAVSSLLAPVKGIGPRVLATFFLLRDGS